MLFDYYGRLNYSNKLKMDEAGSELECFWDKLINSQSKHGENRVLGISNRRGGIKRLQQSKI